MIARIVEWYDDACRWFYVYVIEPIEWRVHCEMLKRDGKWCYDCEGPSTHCACAPGN